MKPPTKPQKKELSNEEVNEETNVLAKETTIELPEETKVRKRYSFDLDTGLMKQMKVHSVLQEKNVYELMEDAIRDYLNKVK